MTPALDALLRLLAEQIVADAEREAVAPAPPQEQTTAA